MSDGVASAVEQAKSAAGDKAVTVVGGARLIAQLLSAGRVDELHVDVMPVLLGGGLRLFDDVDPSHVTLKKLGTQRGRGADQPALQRPATGHHPSMKIGSLVVILWLLIGAFAAFQRDYFERNNNSCAKAGTVALTVVAGPLNYLGVNPKVKDCNVPQPSQ